ncbi:Hypothetical protein FKW44_024872 [Caligus rogercresseyi]|uniref:Uncharacterized protein n=1 Tax=Caligus rogercresseyi TaxID=217165 RepID=A0A7T8GLH2_CALRO|nr:Hypothetical protein FKW44_024872 [Caligus rogercresseyi]
MGPAMHSDGVLGFLTLGQRTFESCKNSDGVLGFLTVSPLAQGLKPQYHITVLGGTRKSLADG